jgi:hypothetical protein
LFVAILLSLGAWQTAFADGKATGGFHVPVDGGRIDVEFNARSTDTSGSGDGQMTFSAPVQLGADEDSTDRGSISNVSVTVDFDCVSVTGNRAAMSGLVRSASVNGFVGRRVVLVVEDGGEGINAAPDKFTWGMYADQKLKWHPADAELKFDDGWDRTWIATDAERPDDKGVTFRRSEETPIDCRSFPLSSYTLVDLPAQGGGNIQVNP